MREAKLQSDFPTHLHHFLLLAVYGLDNYLAAHFDHLVRYLRISRPELKADDISKCDHVALLYRALPYLEDLKISPDSFRFLLHRHQRAPRVAGKATTPVSR